VGPGGQLYSICEDSGVVLEIDPKTSEHHHVIAVGSNKAHRIEVLPDGSKLYTENEEDSFASVIDLRARKRVKKVLVPNGLGGIGMSPDGKAVILVDAVTPQVLVVDTATDEVTRAVELNGHTKGSADCAIAPMASNWSLPATASFSRRSSTPISTPRMSSSSEEGR
jgi:DNA-binding beta-propeller fold protein YncE